MEATQTKDELREVRMRRREAVHVPRVRRLHVRGLRFQEACGLQRELLLLRRDGVRRNVERIRGVCVRRREHTSPGYRGARDPL